LIFLFLMTCVITAMATGITVGAIKDGTPPWVAVPLVVSFSAVSSVKFSRSLIQPERRERDKIRKNGTQSEARKPGMTSGAFGSLLRVLGGIGNLIILLCVPISVGLFFVMLWVWSRPLAPRERAARRKLARWLTSAGREHEIPNGWQLSSSAT